MIKTALITLGCAKNQVDSENLLGTLEGGSILIVNDPSEAELIIINTCGFIDQAKEESIDVILSAAQLKKTGLCKGLVVSGCMAQRFGTELAHEIPEIDAIVGFEDYHRFEEICLGLLNGKAASQRPKDVLKKRERRLLSPPHYAYLKVSEGCDNRCSYCTIPDIRGPHRSRPMGEIVDEAEMLVNRGVAEINLIGQDTTLYGTDIYGRQCLHQLLKELRVVTGLRWIRFLYTHPAHWYPKLIRELADNEKVVKYVDMPLQHTSNRLLKTMNRKTDRQQMESLIADLRSEVPDLTLRTTFIVGLPGEGDSEFDELLEFVEQSRFQRLGAFTYSREDGTPASLFPEQVDEEVKQQRLDELMSLQQEISLSYNREMIGSYVEVLVEGQRDEEGRQYGRSAAHAPEVDGGVLIVDGQVEAGSFVQVKVTDATDYDLIGKIV